MGDSTPRMQRHRAHAEGDHSICNESCTARRALESVNEYRLRAKVLMDRGCTDSRVMELAELELPDYDYLDAEPDAIHRLATERDEWKIEDWFRVYEQFLEQDLNVT